MPPTDPAPPANAPDLLVEVAGRSLRLPGSGTSYRVGRTADADVVLTAPSVSRQHATVDRVGSRWVLRDAGSAHGTFVDGLRVEQHELRGDGWVDVTCGPEPDGAAFTLGLAPLADRDVTQAIALPRAEAASSGGTVRERTGPDLQVLVEGTEHRFTHPARITVGRRGDCTVVIADPSVSREHGRVDAVPGGWTWTNLSSEGTFERGRRVGSRTFDTRVSLRLGHPVAGPEVTLVPLLSAAEEERRIVRRRRRRGLVAAGTGVLALLLVAGLAAGVLRAVGDDPAPGAAAGLSATDLDRAKAATVKITARTAPIEDAGGTGEGASGTSRPPSRTTTYHASGSIISSDGLILTNAHVARPEARGLDASYGGTQLRNPPYLLISLTNGTTDTNAAPSYRAKVVVADGRLDAAIVRIYARADGSELDGELDLPTVPIGESSDLRAGDAITVLGFPAVAGAGESITVTTGVVSTVLNDRDLGPRSELDTDARIAPGNSGGMAIDDDGRLIGVPTSLFADEDTTVTSGRVRTIDVLKDLIRRAEAETR